MSIEFKNLKKRILRTRPNGYEFPSGLGTISVTLDSSVSANTYSNTSGGQSKTVVEAAEGANVVITFTSTGNLKFVGTSDGITNVNAEMLIVGAGGAGGFDQGGGGGAGGILYTNNVPIINNTNYVVSIGSGGTATGVSPTKGGTGSNSSVVCSPASVSLIADGGGGGGSLNTRPGSPGGSGGGGNGYNNNPDRPTGGSAIGPSDVTGFPGGGGGQYHGGGGGGAGGAGTSQHPFGGPGGAGLEYSIAGPSPSYYAGGGGGGSGNQPGGTGGSSVGGNGGGPGAGGNPAESQATNRGSGGGGAHTGGPSGAGGNGVVIIRYKAQQNADINFTAKFYEIGGANSGIRAPS